MTKFPKRKIFELGVSVIRPARSLTKGIMRNGITSPGSAALGRRASICFEFRISYFGFTIYCYFPFFKTPVAASFG